ncbi:MAG: beta-glucosidase [Synechococcales cyanobacterium T60_A2020_003]|nr:beta-glucosidase [Synechococcales cyanobacterium T60_A2020_003]
MSSSYRFPENFLWGAATAAYQIEGAVAEGGRKPSVWDTFSATPGRVRDGSTEAIACDHYHRFLDDIKLMGNLGIKHYRFSVAWPRVIPDGRGDVNAAGLDFYSRLVDGLLAQGITPHGTLFHWDSPQALDDRYGSWRSREMASDFADYVSVVVRHLGDRVTNWMTINEIVCFTHMGYGVRQVPVHAPGTVVNSLKEVWQTSHHALLAHGMACQAIRATSPQPCSVALVDNPMVPVPLSESPEHIEAAQKAFRALNPNGGIIVPALTGRYSAELLEQLGNDAPAIAPEDLEIIHQPLDRLGVNIYTGVYVRATDTPVGYEILPFPAGYPRLHMPWLHIVPDSLYWVVRHIRESLGQENLPIVVSENGCAAQDELTEHGEVMDSDRILYLREYLRAVHRAVSEGYPVNGYFVWSLMDNFEWSWGCDRRFGVTWINYETQARIPKASYRWYAECIRQNRVV